MKTKVSRLTAVLFLVLVLGLSMARTLWGQARNNAVMGQVIWDSNETLQPGVLHGWVLGSISVNRGYVVEVTPLDTDTSFLADGECVKAFVEPEFNKGTGEWSDVLRVQLFPEDATAPLNVNVRVYAFQKAAQSTR